MYPLKTLENPWFSDIFYGYKNESLAYSRGIRMDHWPKIGSGDVSAYGKLTSF